MRNFPWKDILVLFIAAAIAVGIIFVVKKVILSPIHPHLTKEDVFGLEVFVFLLLMAAFINGEIFHWFEAVRRWINREKLPEMELTWNQVAMVLAAFMGSLVIYVGFVTFLKLP